MAKRKWTKTVSDNGSVTFKWPSGYAETWFPEGQPGTMISMCASYGASSTLRPPRAVSIRRLPRVLWKWFWLFVPGVMLGRGSIGLIRPDAPLWRRCAAVVKSYWVEARYYG